MFVAEPAVELATGGDALTGRRMLNRMPDTTVRVSPLNRDRLRAIAEAEGLTMDEALALLLRRHRQREIGSQLSTHEPDAADRAVLDTGADTVARR